MASRFIHVPERHFGYWNRIRGLENLYGDNLTDEVLLEELDIDEKHLKRLRKSLGSCITMLEDIVLADSNRDWTDFVPDRSYVGPDEVVGLQDLRTLLIKQMEFLPRRTQQMLSSMFLHEHKPTLGDLSRRHGVSKERCRQVCEAGLRKLRVQLVATLKVSGELDTLFPQRDTVPELALNIA